VVQRKSPSCSLRYHGSQVYFEGTGLLGSKSQVVNLCPSRTYQILLLLLLFITAVDAVDTASAAIAATLSDASAVVASSFLLMRISMSMSQFMLMLMLL